MATISYRITSKNEQYAAPFVAELIPSSIPVNIHNTTGTYQFINVPNGVFTLTITDSNGCVFSQDLNIDPNVTTTTTTQAPKNSIIIGNTQDQTLIFNVNGTNRNTHYTGFPNVNVSTLFLWLKTLDGTPLTVQKVINYSIASVNSNVFQFNALSDEIHTNIVPSISTPSLDGQLILKIGFIETYFMYTYIKNPVLPNFQINLNTTTDLFYTNIPLTGGTNQYGVTHIDRQNIIMNF